MEVKVDYEKIYNYGSNITKDNENLLAEFNNLLEIIDNLKSSWDGTDYNNFKTTAVTYIEDQKDMIDKIDFMGKFMIYSSSTYEKMNEEWGEKMKRIREDKNDKINYN